MAAEPAIRRRDARTVRRTDLDAGATLTDPRFVEPVTAAHQYLTARQEDLKTEFGLSWHGRWDWDSDRGTIVFSDAGVARVIAKAQLVGSVSKRTGTWL